MLNITPENKLYEWSQILNSILETGSDICFVGDTETTGKHAFGDKKNRGIKDRILEIALIPHKMENGLLGEEIRDKNGELVFFHEYINPFIESHEERVKHNSISFIPPDVIQIHGIDLEFLNARSGLLDNNGNRTDFLLTNPAPSFSEIKNHLELFLCTKRQFTKGGDVFVCFHNAPFDIGFLNAEWERVEMFVEKHQSPSSFESFVKVMDTLKIIKEIYPNREDIAKEITPDNLAILNRENENINTRNKIKLTNYNDNTGFEKNIKSGFTLDYLKYYYGLHYMDRDLHGAMIDTKILALTLKSMQSDKRFIKFIKNREINNVKVISTNIPCNNIKIIKIKDQ